MAEGFDAESALVPVIFGFDLESGELVVQHLGPGAQGMNDVAVAPSGDVYVIGGQLHVLRAGADRLATGAVRFLDAPEDTSLYGIDGLYWHEGDLVGIQNGLQPWRLLRLSLNTRRTAVEAVRIIELANEEVSPMTGAIVGERIHYIGRRAGPGRAAGTLRGAPRPL